jgi:hypothetical protein
MTYQLFKDGEPVEYVLGGHGIMLYGVDITGRKCLVSDHYVDPRLLTPGASFRTGGHHWEVKHPAKFHSMD